MPKMYTLKKRTRTIIETRSTSVPETVPKTETLPI